MEDNLKVRFPSNHLVIPWLIEHVAMLMNKYSINAEGKTPYEHMHGRKCNAKIVEFGERCYYCVPKKLRAKLDRRWRLGVYLGMRADSTEHYLGAWNGDVVKSRSVVRVLEKSR